MKKGIGIISFTVACIFYLAGCNTGGPTGVSGIATDTASIDRGEVTFDQYCGGCHNFRQDAIGPQLSGITLALTPDWIRHFISDPQKIIAQGDAHAVELSKKFHTVMPSFAFLKEDQVNTLLAFLNAHQKGGKAALGDTNNVKNPVPAKIAVSGLQVKIQQITQAPASVDSGKMPRTRITKFYPQPVTGVNFILDLRGKMYRLAGDQLQVYMDMGKLNPAFINEPGLATGFGSFAFHPEFATNGLLYTAHTEKKVATRKADFGYADSIKTTVEWVITEWKASQPSAPVFSGTPRELFRVDMVSGIHGVQELTFNPLSKPGDADYGLLYIGVGDGGSVEGGYPFLAHSHQKPWGSILRIDPAGRNSANGKYGIPAGNPFVKSHEAGALGEIYAYGFRNPHRITWTKTGQMLVSNVGQANIESLNLIEPGHDYGWPLREGNFLLNPAEPMDRVYALPANDSSFHFTYPVAEYDHDEGAAISGGYEYQGAALPALKGKFLFGDIPSGRLFYIDVADIHQGRQATIKEWKLQMGDSATTLQKLCGGGRIDLHFGRDAQGEMYILTKADGKIYKMVGATEK